MKLMTLLVKYFLYGAKKQDDDCESKEKMEEQLNGKEKENADKFVDTLKLEICPCPFFSVDFDESEHGKSRIGSFQVGTSQSDFLAPGDLITSINDKRVHGLRGDQINELFRGAKEKVLVELEYELPSIKKGSSYTSSKTTQITLSRDSSGFGFTLRGGVHKNPSFCRPITIINVRPGGPADREGTIRIGDRLLAIDDLNLEGITLADVHKKLRESGNYVDLTVEYDVREVPGVENAISALLVEYEKPYRSTSGISLAQSSSGAVLIDNIKPGSVADRCGALRVNDIILGINGARIDSLKAIEVMSLLDASDEKVSLEILPASAQQASRVLATPLLSRGRFANTLQGIIGSPGLLTPKFGRKLDSNSSRSPEPDLFNNSSTTTGASSTSWTHFYHPEVFNLTLIGGPKGGVGIALENKNGKIVIKEIDGQGSASRSGCLQPGDRVLTLNGQPTSTLGVIEASRLLGDLRPTARVDISIECDVAHSVVPASGVFTVKLANHGFSLGIKLTASSSRNVGEPFTIGAIKGGSAAHRCGSIAPGDYLLAVDGTRLEMFNLEEAAQVLSAASAGEVTTLRIQKDDSFSESPEGGSVVYTVELVRHGGPLGITVSGSEDPFEPILISGLTPGGLSEQTGAVHVGDRLLAINGSSLRAVKLSDAIAMLQDASDIITLKISRQINTQKSVAHHQLRVEADREDFIFHYGNSIPSVDSAVESWDSGGFAPSSAPLSVSSPLPDITPMEPIYSSDTSTIRRKANCRSSSSTRESHSPWAGSSNSLESHTKSEKIYSEWPPPPSDLANARQAMKNNSNNSLEATEKSMPQIPRCCTLPSRRKNILLHPELELKTSQDSTYGSFCGMKLPPDCEIYHVLLEKDSVYEDFGFSVSDGLYEKGVFVNRIRKGGPAEASGILKPFDRILQVNNTRTHDFDCCLTVPLIASAGEKMTLVVMRHPNSTFEKLKDRTASPRSPWMDEEDYNTELPPFPPTISTTL
ncbi:glutamate receptor-interacting protein 2-like isoform X3 [Artemia franciscana]|uniref:glutamate receptor-interacting protein 2-like isoform X3 n=1 Tax=Artemia franciscana TaxID=6661 RepID=UPI0032DBB799